MKTNYVVRVQDSDDQVTVKARNAAAAAKRGARLLNTKVEILVVVAVPGLV